MSGFRFPACCLILWFIAATQAQGSQTGCSSEELKNILQPSDPAYADAIELAGSLQKRGFTIQCVLPSKFGQFVPRQTGAALFRTTMGDFETLFRPKEQDFDDVLISEEKDVNLPSGSSYHYIFRNPHGRKFQDSWGRETFFVRHHNILFVTWQKDALACLTDAVQDER